MYKMVCLAMLTVSLVSCGSMIPKPHEIPAPDRVFIHKNPRVGDFAVYSAGSNMTHRYEVHKRTGNRVTVRYRLNYTTRALQGAEPKEWYYRQITTSGRVLKAWAVTDQGVRSETPVGRPNSMGGYEQLTAIRKRPKYPIAVASRQIRVDSVNAYIYRVDAGMVKTRSSCLEYYSSRVPFRVLKREMVHSADKGAFLKSLETLQAAGESYFNDDYLEIYKRATQKPMKYQSTYELIQYGFGS